MTTDITERAQREKFEAWAHSQKLSLAYGDCGYAFSSTEMAWRAWMASSAELVEALEKAQGMEAYWKTQCRGITDHCEELQARIAELESRTVKLPDDAEHDIMAPVAAYLSEKFKWDGGAARWDGRKEYDVLADRVKYALRMVIRRAAGIKVEAE
ncbi:TPA: hypothetical protein ACTXEN_000430 [Raoultella planticola]